MEITRIEKVKKKTKACAYVRVSTKQDEQEDSFNAQKEYWESKLKNNPEIDFIGIFADEGISGSKVEERTGYQRMMELVRAGEIDRIYVKSISRFGRNKLEALRAIQEIRDLNSEIIFEKEHLTTSDPKCSFSLTVMTAFAEHERESISQNVQWSYQKKLERGELTFYRCFGYEIVDGKPRIIEEEAKWVRFIFDAYAFKRKPHEDIKDELNALGARLPSGSPFTTSSVRNIIRNPVYVGDSVRRQTIIRNGSRVANKGEVKKYYFRDSHEGIVDRNTFEIAQGCNNSTRGRRKTRGIPLSSGGPLSRKLRCSECDSIFKPTSDGLWVCPGYETGCQVTILQESAVIAMVRKCLSKFNESLGNIEGMKKHDDEIQRLERKAKSLNTKMLNGLIDEIEYEVLMDELNEELAKKQEMVKSLKIRKGVEWKVDKMKDADVLAELKVGIVHPDKSIEITLQNGFIAKIKYPRLDREGYKWKL